ncbi:MAG: tRNA preQ1(34) S-adenosylmethionine ribosyltransferase-isomerase QueA [Thermodesulforhabdaceae bacterium]
MIQKDERLSYRLEDYDYELPEELIALEPSPRRDESRLLVLHRSTGTMEHTVFRHVVNFLREGDVLIMNDTKVVPARLYGRKETGGRVELLVLEPFADPETAKEKGYECLVKASKPFKPGMKIELVKGTSSDSIDHESSSVIHKKPVLTVMDVSGEGKVRVLLPEDWNIVDLLYRYGEVPLPPYIRRSKTPGPEDLERYQTVYARYPGAIAAPTAGFHFTGEILEALRSRGVTVDFVTLHVGYGTFEPVKTEDVRHHRMHKEWCEVSKKTAELIKEAKLGGRRVTAVGTTVVRTLEGIVAAHFDNMDAFPYRGFCDCYIVPGFQFRIVDAMITNFHLPKSSLILLVSAFAGRSLILTAYREAIARRYRFYSYGDAMLIL